MPARLTYRNYPLKFPIYNALIIDAKQPKPGPNATQKMGETLHLHSLLLIALANFMIRIASSISSQIQLNLQDRAGKDKPFFFTKRSTLNKGIIGLTIKIDPHNFGKEWLKRSCYKS